ncbi:putative gustatory receptor 58b [Drosophila obscura]|uniref:putative gustatory receptor 58b n=1 Tax=Drosophila obscura TaxID=7282 RepID=UPI001BB1D034|nr:putative gustatory receptor 58b [Drosophila obscura]XP_041447758.1 putative gustatory receptor 58b [Drosophila obscura]
MLHPKLGLALRVAYYHALVFGLMGTTLQIRGKSRLIRVEKVSWMYLAYSVLISGCLLLDLYFIVPRAIVDGYIHHNIVLQWNFFSMLVLRIAAIFCSYGLVWLQRRRLIKLYVYSLYLWRSYRRLLKRLVDQRTLEELQLSVTSHFWRNTIVVYGSLLCSSVVQYQLLSVINRQSLMALFSRLSQILHVVAVKIAFYALLQMLDHQFRVVHLALRALQRRRGGKKKVVDLRRIAALHLDTYQLARRFFGLYDVANAMLFVTMFMTSMSILYHAVLYNNQSIHSDGWGALFGSGLVVSNIYSTLMLMDLLDHVVSSCNDVGQTLRQFSNLRKISKELQIGLEIFGSQVHRHRLVYKICGLVEINNSACLSYISCILSNVIILMQFDLRRKQEAYVEQTL